LQYILFDPKFESQPHLIMGNPFETKAPKKNEHSFEFEGNISEHIL